ncbi:DEAD/DEAH box helicase [Vibrio parahaemolyticus]|uniref:DEAD/DEAH box helicase n=1 Tax=Vibrio parahaemolyticus TaxID=670 RepID=UPI0032989D8B
MLRAWQQDCVDSAISHFIQGNKHFLAQATPGAGKTVMAANLTKQLFELSLIDFVVCFSPSKIISASIRESFAKILEKEMDGSFGSLGISITYQSVAHLDDNFWSKLLKYRVLCVFDEIHHCGGNNEQNSNSWGQQILCKIQKVATYTLALTGTPWRSDLIPITLASYSDPEGKVICNYQYTLKQAVADDVCRRPKIVLIDCESPVVNTNGETLTYNSIHELVETEDLNYSSILSSWKATHYLLSEAVNKLNRIRQLNPAAGGLIVASSIKHAKALAHMLETEFSQSTCTVTHQDINAQSRIEAFKTSQIQWIVSVGMVSEGTDIPRLQVCCHLSNIKTELYFRQILGRILRRTKDINQEAWLYTFAEPKLASFSNQVEIDIPDSCMFRTYDSESSPTTNDENSPPLTQSESKDETIKTPSENSFIWQNDNIEKINGNAELQNSNLILRQFRLKVIEAFRYG